MECKTDFCQDKPCYNPVGECGQGACKSHEKCYNRANQCFCTPKDCRYVESQTTIMVYRYHVEDLYGLFIHILIPLRHKQDCIGSQRCTRFRGGQACKPKSCRDEEGCYPSEQCAGGYCVAPPCSTNGILTQLIFFVWINQFIYLTIINKVSNYLETFVI